MRKDVPTSIYSWLKERPNVVKTAVSSTSQSVDTVEPGVWRRNFPWVFASKFWWGWAIAGTSFDLSTGRLAGGKMQKNFDLSTGQSSRGIPTGIGLRRCRTGRKRCMLWPGIWLEHFYGGKWLGIAYFLTSVFPRAVSPATSRKESRTYPFNQVRLRFTPVLPLEHPWFMLGLLHQTKPKLWV